MRAKEASAVLVFIAGFLLSGFSVNGDMSMTTTVEAGIVLSNNVDACPSHAKDGEALCSSVHGNIDLTVLLSTGELEDFCKYSLLQYGCAKLENITSDIAFAVLRCYLQPEAVTSQETFSLFISQISIDILGATINKISIMIPASSITPQVKLYLLNAVWERLQQDEENLAACVLATWFQDRLYFLLSAFNSDIMDCILSLNITCEALEAVVGALDVARATLDNATSEEIGKGITQFIQTRSCYKGSLATSITFFYKSFIDNVNYDDLVTAFGEQQWSSALSVFTYFQLAQYADKTGAFNSLELSSDVLNILDTKNLTFLTTFLSQLSANSYNTEVMFKLLQSTMVKVNSADDSVCKPSLKIIFQGISVFVYASVNETILELFAPQSCSEFQNLYQAVDIAYDKLSDDIKESLYRHRRDYLKEEATKSGSGCTYGLSSEQWVDENFGKSVEYASYSSLVELNNNFDGYEAISYLNINQIVDLIIETHILTDENPIHYESRVSSITNFFKYKNIQSLQGFLIQLNFRLTELQINFIVNVQVRSLLLKGFWSILVEQLSGFTQNDWYIWFNEYLSIYVASITSEELSYMSGNVVGGCSSSQSVVQGLDNVFNYMSQDTIYDVANWIVDTYRSTSDSCITDNWLNDNFKHFGQYVYISVLKELNSNYNLLENLRDLSATQIGYVAVTNEEARTNVTLVKEIFSLIISGSEEENIENLGSFWDSYNEAYDEGYTVTEEVKYEMLQSTTSVLSSQFTSVSSEEITVWFEERLSTVITVIDSNILSGFSVNVGCGSSKSFVHALSSAYEGTDDSNKQDVLDYFFNSLANGTDCTSTETTSMSFIESSFGNYFDMVSYEEIITYYSEFNAFESGVLEKMTVTQIGDMIVEANIYESIETTTQLFEYLSTLSVESVDACMTKFTETAIMKKIEMTNEVVGQHMLKSYLTIIQSKIQSEGQEYLTQLFELRLTKLIKFFTAETLVIIIIKDCDTLITIVLYMDQGINSMSVATKNSIAAWIIGILKSLNQNACKSSSVTTSSSWSQTVMKGFFQFTSLKEVQEVYTDFDVLSVISVASISQKVEYLVTSNALSDVEVTTTVLESLKGEDNLLSVDEVYGFLGEFNSVYEGETMSTEVKQETMTYLFSGVLENLSSMTEVQKSEIKETFSVFLSGVGETVLDKIPTDISCDNFETIFDAFSSVFGQLPEPVASSAYDKILGYLSTNSKGSSDACGSLYTDSKSYINNIYFSFSSFASISVLYEYYSKFDAYEVLGEFSGEQLGELFITTSAITDLMEAVQILVELEKRDYEEVTSFMSEINLVAKEKGLESLPDANVESLLVRAIWPTISEHLKTEEDFKFWFEGSLSLVAGGITTREISSISKEIDCTSQSHVVKCFNNAFDNLDDDEKSFVYGNIKDYNKHVKDTTGHACKTDSGSSSDWAEMYYGPFIKYSSLEELKSENSDFNEGEALSVLSGAQVADYVIGNGGLQDESVIITVFDSITTTEKVTEFLQQCNSEAPEKLRESSEVELIVSKVFDIIKVDFGGYQSEDWKQLTQVTLENILFAVDETELETFPIPLNCDSYHEVVKGFDKSFHSMKEVTKKSVFNKCIKHQLDSIGSNNGVRCGETTDRTQAWLDSNLGSFAEYASISDLSQWSVKFQATDVINTVSATQLATVAVQQINKEEVAYQIAGRVEQFEIDDVYSFLDIFSSSLQELNIKITDAKISLKFLSLSISAIKIKLSSYSASDWSNLLSVRLQPFLSSIDKEQLSVLLGSADCDGYAIIIEQLSNIFDDFSHDVQTNLYEAIRDYADAHVGSSGVCPVSGEESSATVKRLFGKFCVFFGYADFSHYIPSFNGLSAIGSLSASQIGELAFSGDALNNQESAQILINSVSGMSFDQVDNFLFSFQTMAEKGSILSLPNFSIQSSLFNAIFEKISPQFAMFTTTQWADYCQGRFRLFVTSLNADQIERIPTNGTCDAFHTIMSAMSRIYKAFSEDIQQAIFTKAKSYLEIQSKLSPTDGPACPTGTGDSSDWLTANLGAFSSRASIEDITAVYPEFQVLSAVQHLTASQLGSYAANLAILSDTDKITTVLSGISSLNIGNFLETFNVACNQKGITEITNAQVKNLFLGEIFCKLSSAFSSFTVSDYNNWFQGKLKFFVDSVNAKVLGFLPVDISCDSLAAIVEGLSVQNPENPGDVYSFIKSVLRNQKPGACTGGGLDSRGWVTKYFSRYIAFASWSEIIQFNPTIKVMEISDMLTTVQLASASTSSTVIHNSTAITTLVFSFSGDMEAFYNYMSSLRISALQDPTLLSSTKMRDSLLMSTAQILFPQFTFFSDDQFQNWITQIAFLLPSINSIILNFIPMDLSCSRYQIIVSSLEELFQSLVIQKQKDIAAFEQAFLTYKAQSSADGDPCSAGLSSTAQYVMANFGSFCSLMLADDVALFYPSLNKESFTAFCNLS